MMTAKPSARTLVHTPAEMMADYVSWAEAGKRGEGIPFGVPAVDQKMIPMRPGQLITVLGRPGMGKTSLLAFLARQEAKRIAARSAIDKECVVYTTWEQSAEELTAFFLASKEHSISDVAWGRVDLDIIRKQAVKGIMVPIWIIGHGISRAGKDAPRMTADVVLSAIESMEADFGIKPTLLLFDYLQLIPSPKATERVQQVSEATIRIKELALRAGVPAVAGVQAARDVDDREEKLPEARDAQWASSIEQTSDKMFSLWRPCQSQDIGTTVKVESGKQYAVTDTLFFLRMLKQRGDAGRFTWALHFDPAYLHLAELETRVMGRGDF